jgi:hypothetical protein
MLDHYNAPDQSDLFVCGRFHAISDFTQGLRLVKMPVPPCLGITRFAIPDGMDHRAMVIFLPTYALTDQMYRANGPTSEHTIVGLPVLPGTTLSPLRVYLALSWRYRGPVLLMEFDDRLLCLKR